MVDQTTQYRKNTDLRPPPATKQSPSMTALASTDYGNIFMHAPIGMGISRFRIIHACNEALARMFAFQPSELINRSFSAFYPTVDEFERTGAHRIDHDGRRT
jgi:hypothetical protein